MKALLTGFALLLFASTATAADGVSRGGWYVGIGGGQSSLRDTCSFAASLSPPAVCDDESVAAKALLGKHLYKYASLELSYTDAGEAKLAQTAAPTGTLEVNPRLLTLYLNFDLPIAVGGRLGLIGKVGMTYYDTKYNRTGSFLIGVPDSDDGITSALGAGLSWRGWKHASFRAEWEHFNDVSINNGDVDIATISLLFHF